MAGTHVAPVSFMMPMSTFVFMEGTEVIIPEPRRGVKIPMLVG